MVLRLDSALRMAQADDREQGPTPLEIALLDEHPPAAMGRLHYPTSDDPDCSEGGAAAAPAGAEQLLTQAAAALHATLSRGLQRDVEGAVHTGLAALCTSAYFHAHTAHMHALHARGHDPPLAGGTPLQSHDPTGDVGVDGSYHPHTGAAAAGVAYLVRGQDGLLEVHITNATFAGAQSAQDAEVAALALSLRLAPLHACSHSTSAGTASLHCATSGAQSEAPSDRKTGDMHYLERSSTPPQGTTRAQATTPRWHGCWHCSGCARRLGKPPA
jgi:hypothetical protein